MFHVSAACAGLQWSGSVACARARVRACVRARAWCGGAFQLGVKKLAILVVQRSVPVAAAVWHQRWACWRIRRIYSSLCSGESSNESQLSLTHALIDASKSASSKNHHCTFCSSRSSSASSAALPSFPMSALEDCLFQAQVKADGPELADPKRPPVHATAS